MRFPPHDRTFSMTAVKDLDVQHLDDDDDEEDNDLVCVSVSGMFYPHLLKQGRHYNSPRFR